MFEILLLLAAAFSGHEVVATVDTAAPQAAPAAQSVIAAPADRDVDFTAANPVIRIADDIAPSTSKDSTNKDSAAKARDAGARDSATKESVGKNSGAEDSLTEDPEVEAAINRVTDFYDTTPPTAPEPTTRAADKRTVAAAAPSAETPRSTRSILGPHLVGSTENYVSEGHPVVIEVLRPDDDDRRPAVLILHGASGIGDGAFYRSTAEIFAERGYVTFLPHYLAAARAIPAKKAKGSAKTATAQTRGQRPPDGSIRAGFPRQEQILRDAIDYIGRNPYVDSDHIGVFGLSLGGFHALTLSSHDGRIAAVVDMSGALRGNVIPDTNHLAPTLELHGARDPIVPVARARSLAAMLDRLGVPHQLQIYPNQGHFLRGKAQEDALQRAAAFFGTYLTPSDSNRAARSGGSVD